jgi:hypothetical protein
MILVTTKMAATASRTYCFWPSAAAGLRPVKRLQIVAGYKACNMLATISYGWRSMVKLNKIGEYSSILTNDSPTTTTTTE